MPDKTAFEISGELHLYIEDLVKRVVLDGKPFDDKEKKWLQRYSLMEGLDHEALENSLMAFLETIGGLNYHTHKPLERFLKPLSLQAAECFVSETLVSDIIKRKREIGKKEEHQAQENIKLLRDDSTFQHFPNIQKELMAYAYKEDFYTTFFQTYKAPLGELLVYINDISELLQDKVLTDAYPQLSSEADSFFERAKKAQCGEIETIRIEGGELKEKIKGLAKKARLIRVVSDLLLDKEVGQSKEFGKFSEEVNLFIERVRKTPYNELDAIKKEGRELKEGIANKARLIRDISSLLEVKEVRLSKEFAKFSEEVNLYIERVRKTPYNELDAIKKEGEKLKKQGEKILNQTKKKNVVEHASITIVSTIVDVLLWVLCFNWSVDNGSFMAFLKGLLFVLLFISLLVLLVMWYTLFDVIEDYKKYKKS